MAKALKIRPKHPIPNKHIKATLLPGKKQWKQMDSFFAAGTITKTNMKLKMRSILEDNLKIKRRRLVMN